MEKLIYSHVNEILYTDVLANGLRVTIIPKKDFHKTYSLFTTNYGSIDNEFIPLGKKDFIKVPDGVAHFLEHKMFEKEDGDVFQLFSKLGASANAFTSFTKTSYLFSSTDFVMENLEVLLDFVQSPYFTEQTVEKEKGIIGQEIQMYQDEPDWRLLFGLLNNLYPKHPLHIDIAGTVESIAQITAQDLYTCYETFYHPSNMNLLVVGNVEPEEVFDFVSENQMKKQFAPAKSIQRRFPAEEAQDIVANSSLRMPVTRPKVLLGVKGLQELPTKGRDILRRKVATNLLFELLFGSTSKNYLRLYQSGVIDDTFSADFTIDRGFYFADIGGDTDEPEKLAEEVKTILLQGEESQELTEKNLRLLKKEMLGKHLQSLNSLEYVARQLSQLQSYEATLFDLSTVIEEIQLSDVHQICQDFLRKEAISCFTILPTEEV